MGRKALLLAISVLLIVTAFLGCNTGGDKRVNIRDSLLEEAVREALEKPEGSLYASELATLTSLSVPRGSDEWIPFAKQKISNLTGLEYCVKLRNLSINKHLIKNLSPLASLTKLTELDLWRNEISDLSPLTSLPNLTELDLGKNQINDFSPLTSLPNLTKLDLRENPLNTESLNVYIPQLEKRGVRVWW